MLINTFHFVIIWLAIYNQARYPQGIKNFSVVKLMILLISWWFRVNRENSINYGIPRRITEAILKILVPQSDNGADAAVAYTRTY